MYDFRLEVDCSFVLKTSLQVEHQNRRELTGLHCSFLPDSCIDFFYTEDTYKKLSPSAILNCSSLVEEMVQMQKILNSIMASAVKNPGSRSVTWNKTL